MEAEEAGTATPKSRPTLFRSATTTLPLDLGSSETRLPVAMGELVAKPCDRLAKAGADTARPMIMAPVRPIMRRRKCARFLLNGSPQ